LFRGSLCFRSSLSLERFLSPQAALCFDGFIV
jgi:hypothetical protein